MLSQRFLRPSSFFFFFILFPWCCSAVVISTIRSSRSFTHSASVFLLLMPSSIFFNFSYGAVHHCLSVLYFFYIPVKHFLHFLSPYPSYYFQDFGSSLLLLLWILFQVGCLFPLHLLGLISFYFTSSSVTYFPVVSLFVDGWGCAPVFLITRSEASSTGSCRQLGRTQCWCRDEDLQESSHWLLFPGVWSSLVVQWLGLGTIMGAQAWPLAWEPRPSKSWGFAVWQKRNNKNKISPNKQSPKQMIKIKQNKT